MTEEFAPSAPERLFHISEEPNISRFEPRPPPSASAAQTGAMVWAVGQRFLHNYLLPRDCPRVTFYAGAGSSAEDIARLLGTSSSSYVVAIETAWMAALRSGRLYQYELPPDTFARVDAPAGYYISRKPVIPLDVIPITDMLGALLASDVELRVMPSLWKLHDAVASSTLQFSIIRMRNALPRE